MADLKLRVEPREGTGKNRVDKLRVKDLIPGVLYRKGQESVPVQVEARAFDVVFKEAGTSTLVDVNLEGKVVPALIKEVQKHPFRNELLHIDFQGIRMDEKIKLSVPILLEGRDEIRLQPSILNQILNEIEIQCLPGDLPDNVTYNVVDMDFETPVYVKDLAIFDDENIEVLADGEDLVATLSEPQEQEEEEDLDGEEVEAGDVPTVDETEQDEEETEE